MKILVMAITYNCANVAPFFVRHYAQFATKIVCFDDHSTDGTREILDAHPLVSLRDWPYASGIDEDLFQKFWQEEYPKARGEFDWVCILDPDEFLVPKSSHTMPETLEIARSHGWQVVNSVGFNLTGPHFPVDDGRQIYEVNPQGVYAPVYSKPVIFDPMADINWSRGRHMLENCHVASSPPMVRLLHARYFGKDYTALKNAQNLDRCVDKGVAWTCLPSYNAPHLEHSPLWSEYAATKAFNVMEQPI